MGLPVTKASRKGKYNVARDRYREGRIYHPHRTIRGDRIGLLALAEWMNDNNHDRGNKLRILSQRPGTTVPEDLQTVIFIPVKKTGA
jgi:hypothetical protein